MPGLPGPTAPLPGSAIVGWAPTWGPPHPLWVSVVIRCGHFPCVPQAEPHATPSGLSLSGGLA